MIERRSRHVAVGESMVGHCYEDCPSFHFGGERYRRIYIWYS
jgi:hypothetical protein